MGEEGQVLEDHLHPTPRGRQAHLPSHQDVPPIGRVQTRQKTKQRRLAGPRAPDDDGCLPRIQPKGDIPQDLPT